MHINDGALCVVMSRLSAGHVGGHLAECAAGAHAFLEAQLLSLHHSSCTASTVLRRGGAGAEI